MCRACLCVCVCANVGEMVFNLFFRHRGLKLKTGRCHHQGCGEIFNKAEKLRVWERKINKIFEKWARATETHKRSCVNTNENYKFP